jgi:hypothetical protein
MECCAYWEIHTSNIQGMIAKGDTNKKGGIHMLYSTFFVVEVNLVLKGKAQSKAYSGTETLKAIALPLFRFIRC